MFRFVSIRGLRRAALAVAWGVSFAAALDAVAAPPPPTEWEVEIAPYGWLALAHGQVDTPRGDQEFTIDAHDVLKAFDLGAMGSVKARWRRFVFLTDVAWAKLSADDALGDTRVDYDAKLKLGWFEALGGYRVYERPGGLFGTPSPTEDKVFAIDLLTGITYSWTKLELDLSREPIFGFVPPQERELRPTENWVAPYLAARFQNDFTPRLRHETLLGLGGFSAGDAPDLSWQVTSLFSYAITEHWLVTLGYRALGFRDQNVDTTFHGPILGAGFRFGGRR